MTQYMAGNKEVSNTRNQVRKNLDILGLGGDTWVPVDYSNQQWAPGSGPLQAAAKADQAAGYARGMATAAGHQQAPQMQQSGFRGGQEDLISALQQRASGAGGPSPAEMQMRRALEIMNAQALGAARSATGMAPGLAMRNAQEAQMRNSQAIAAQSAIMRSQEQQQAQQMLASVLQGARAQDQGLGQANIGATLQNQAQVNQAQLGYTDAYMNALGQYGQMQLGYGDLGMRGHEAAAQRDMAVALANQQAATAANEGGGFRGLIKGIF